MQAIIKLPFYQISIVAIFYATSRLRNESFCSSLRDNRWLSNQLRHTARFLLRVAFFSLFCETFQRRVFLIQITKFHLKISTWFREKFRHSRDRDKTSIWMSWQTNIETWSMKAKNSLKFSFPLLRRRCRIAVLHLYWFASECLL